MIEINNIPFYCWTSQGRVVVSDQLPDEPDQDFRLINAPTAEVARMIFETDLKLRGEDVEKIGDDGSKTKR